MAIAASATYATALPAYWQEFKKHYNIQADSEAGKAECRVCHIQDPNVNKAINPYGLVLKVEMDKRKTKVMTPEIFQAVETLDVDQDAFTNGDEARAGTMPFNPNSKPDAAAKTQAVEDLKPTTDEELKEKAAAGKAGSPIPRHGYHPVVVHFPIALLIFGALLEAWGARRKDGGIRKAGYWNLVAGTLGSIPAIATGLVTHRLNGYPFSGLSLDHLIWAVAGSVLALVACIWRRKGEVNSALYWIILFAAVVAIGWAGHLGGEMVHG